jgi:hypothetical protein
LSQGLLYKNECRIFKPFEITLRWGLDKKEKNRVDGPIWNIIHLYMETSQEISLCSYLKQQQQKMLFFFFIHLQNQSREDVLPLWCQGGGKRWGKGVGG